MVECAGLEIRYTVIPYRGFESLLLRQTKSSQLAITGCEARRALHHAGLFFQLGHAQMDQIYALAQANLSIQCNGIEI